MVQEDSVAIFTAKALSRLINPKVWVWGAGILLAGWVSFQVYGFVDQALEDRKLVVTQQVQLELRESEIDTLNSRIAQAEEAQRIAEIARRQAELRESELRQIRDNALSTGDERDGELAPVLQDTLRSLRGGGG